MVSPTERIKYESPDHLDFGIMPLNPETAQECLDNNIGCNRGESRQFSAQLISDLRSQRWVQFADTPLMFTASGALLNGANRCRAVIAANVEIHTLYVQGFDDTAFSVIDNGRSRNLRDLLVIMGQRPATAAQLARVVRGVWLARSKMLHCIKSSPAGVTNGDYLDAFIKEPNIVDSVDWAQDIKSRADIGIRHHVWALIRHLVRGGRRMAQRVDAFFEEVATGNSINTRSGSYAYRQYLMHVQYNRANNSLGWVDTAMDDIAALILAWNSYAERRSIRVEHLFWLDYPQQLVGVSAPIAGNRSRRYSSIRRGTFKGQISGEFDLDS